ncbi:MAG: hypothetical protein DME26_22030 [Verrucomicrobia bacterium]|nr:MAG: hypothetical protein DME26_22030 [Verrucomicrobiota bacterium]
MTPTNCYQRGLQQGYPRDVRVLRRSLAAILMASCFVAEAVDESQLGSAANRQPSLAHRGHWAFKPPARPPVSEVKNMASVRTPVDAFILARLDKQNLRLAPEADRVTLIRRLSFDLIGLPPSPEEVAGFVADENADTSEKLVERLLASPHYGERWGRHWLDVAGYADSNGYFDADSDRPLAYQYRDYVVSSFNHDKPFDQFIREQIAGDELVGYHPDSDITPATVELLVATHFLRNAPDGTGESDGNALEQRVDRFSVIEGTVQIVGSVFLGLTVQCARCHDHKFEPFTQEEYYGLQAIFRPAYDPDKWLKPNERALVIGTKAARETNKRAIEKFEREIKTLRDSLEGLTKPFRELALQENLEGIPEADRTLVRKALDIKEKQRTEEMKALLKKHESLVQIKDEELLRKSPELAAGYHTLNDAIKKKEAERPRALPQIAALTEPLGKMPSHHILVRGNYAKPGREVDARVPAVLCSAENVFGIPIQSNGTSGRRSALAHWLTSPDHPTVARLMVNRIWQHHFGVGIVSTPDNFGVTGAKPSHPELLDWLATEFVRSGWSVKALHRLIVNSAAYRQAAGGLAFKSEIRNPKSDIDHRRSKWAAATAMEIDPDNRLLWHFPLQRLEAETIRDSMLAATGELDRHLGGPSVPKARTEEGQFIINETQSGAKRRSLYLQQRRTNPVTLLDVFDAVQMNPNCVQRSASTVPLQSLALLNSDFVRTRSNALAHRLIQETGAGGRDRCVLAFQLTLGRPPGDAELAAATEFLESQMAHYPEKTEEKVWTDFCQMLFASNAFLYVE